MLSYVIDVTSNAIIDKVSCVYRDQNAGTLVEFNDMLSYVNRRYFKRNH